MGGGQLGATCLHPVDGLRVVAEHDVGLVLAEPRGEFVAREVFHAERRDRLDALVMVLKRAEGRTPAVLEALVVVLLQEESRARVAQSRDPEERGEQGAIVVRADGVQGGTLDDVVGVDPRKVRPVEAREIGLVPCGQEEDSVDAA